MATLNLLRDIVLRWEEPDVKHVPLFDEAGVTVVLANGAPPDFVQACTRAGIHVIPASDIRFVSLEELPQVPADARVVLSHGTWPGASRPASDDINVASASRQSWIDSNGYWFAWLRTLYPQRAPVLGYLPDEHAGVKPDRPVPFESLELALVEAWAGGGNYILSVEPRYRAALLHGDDQAVAAWKKLGKTARWLREQAALFQQPAVPIVTALVEPSEETAEIANLLFRHNASPALEPASAPPPPDAASRLAVVAVNLAPGKPAQAERILAHAASGSTVVLDDNEPSAWWRSVAPKLLREESDRTFYSHGAGQLLVYKERISDPGDFALDVIDVVTHKRRAVRLWEAATVIAELRFGPRGGPLRSRVSLAIVNYSSPIRGEILTRVQGTYTSATLLRPESEPLPLKAVRRGTTTEITIPAMRKIGVAVFG